MSDIASKFERYHHVPLLIEVELGRVAMDLQSILKLQEGDVFNIDKAVGVPLRVFAGGVEVGFADLVILENQVAARITRISQLQATGGPNGNP